MTGDWQGVGSENAGVVREHSDGQLRWYLDSDGDPVHEITIAFGLNGDKPVVGDWDGDGMDEVGVYRDGVFFLDVGAPGYQASDPQVFFGLPGDLPIAGDWDQDGLDEVGVFRQGTFYLDVGQPSYQSTDLDVQFGLPGDLPVAGDWNEDGRDDLGVVRDGFADGILRWYLDTDSFSDPHDNTEEILIVYGLAGDQPVVGRWNLPEASVDGVQHGQEQPVNFGSVHVGVPGPMKSFTVRNSGTTDLELGSVDVPNGFSLVEDLFPRLEPGESDSFTIRLDTSTEGTKGDLVRFSTNDGNETPFEFPITGEVLNEGRSAASSGSHCFPRKFQHSGRNHATDRFRITT